MRSKKALILLRDTPFQSMAMELADAEWLLREWERYHALCARLASLGELCLANHTEYFRLRQRIIELRMKVCDFIRRTANDGYTACLRVKKVSRAFGGDRHGDVYEMNDSWLSPTK